MRFKGQAPHPGLALAIAALTIQDTQTVRAAWIAMELIGWFVVVPLALASLVIGPVQSLITPWGLFQHYRGWVLMKLLLTVFATVLLLLHMPRVSYFATVAAETDNANFHGLRANSFTPGAACWCCS